MRVYVCPALMDWLLSLVLFAVSYGAGERGMTLGQVAWLANIFQVTYMAASLVSGRFLSRRNALPILIASAVAGVLSGTLALAAQQFGPIFAAMALLGVFAASFFNSFQSFMRGETAPGGLTRTMAMYTFAWSGGFSLGLLTSGSLYRLGPIALGGLTVLVGGVILLTLLIHRRRPHDEPSSDEHTEQSPPGAPPVAPAVPLGRLDHHLHDHVRATAYPDVLSGRQRGAGHRAGAGRTAAVLSCAGPGPGRTLHGPAAALAVSPRAAGGDPARLPALALLLLWRFPDYTVTAVGISVLGLWAGFSYFCAVYYASNAGHRARNIGINEFLVGLGSFASLFLCEWFIHRTGSAAVMYAVCGSALLVSAAAQWAVLTWKTARASSPTAAS